MKGQWGHLLSSAEGWWDVYNWIFGREDLRFGYVLLSPKEDCLTCQLQRYDSRAGWGQTSEGSFFLLFNSTHNNTWCCCCVRREISILRPNKLNWDMSRSKMYGEGGDSNWSDEGCMSGKDGNWSMNTKEEREGGLIGKKHLWRLTKDGAYAIAAKVMINDF